MKIVKTLPTLLMLISLITIGCSKDNNDNPAPADLTSKQMLTAHTWQIAETYQNLSGTRTHYLRGGENTSGVDMGAMRLKFNADGTGTNTDISGTTYNMTWNFSSADEKNIRMTVNETVVYNWLFTAISENEILQTSLVSTNGLITAKWVPAP
jgi:hypothetical protein